MKRILTTTEVAQELGLEQSAFVKHRARYEDKLMENGFTFLKEGSRQKITYTFETEEKISVDNIGSKIRKTFNIETKGLNKTIDKYIHYISENYETYMLQTDLEVAVALEQHRTNITTVRNILGDAGFIILGETRYFKVKDGNQTQVEVEEWNKAWTNYYYAEKYWMDKAQPKQHIGDKAFNLDSHMMALKHMKEQTGYEWTSKQERMLSFSFLEKLQQYTK